MTPKVRFKLWNIILKMVHDPGTAESIVADAITKAIERVETDRPRQFVPWVYQIAKNMSRRFLRDRKIHEDRLEALGWHERSARSAFSEAISSEALQIFDMELRWLTKAQRQALLFRILDRLSMEEIGVRMGMKSGAVRALLLRARLRLQRWLGYMQAL